MVNTAHTHARTHTHIYICTHHHTQNTARYLKMSEEYERGEEKVAVVCYGKEHVKYASVFVCVCVPVIVNM